MKKILITFLIFFALSLDVSAREVHYLTNTIPQRGTVETQVKKGMCYAGRVKILSFEESNKPGGKIQRLSVEVLETVASSENHPNNDFNNIGDIISEIEDLSSLEVGKTYTIIVTFGSKLGHTVIAYGEDTPEALAELKSIMQSPNAYQNDETWKKRRVLWEHFWEDVGPISIDMYAENTDLNKILYITSDKKYPEKYIYDLNRRESRPVIHAMFRIGAPYNRITYEDGRFILWSSGEPVLFVGG